MTIKKFVKTRKIFKFFLFFIIIGLVIFTIVFSIFDDYSNYKTNDVLNNIPSEQKLKLNRKIIIPEKYNEHIVKSRLIQNKIKYLTQDKYVDGNNNNRLNDDTSILAKNDTNITLTRHVHIFYYISIPWYKRKFLNLKKGLKTFEKVLGSSSSSSNNNNNNVTIVYTPKLMKFVNVAFYPMHGFYKSTIGIIKKHFENIKKCGIGVVILSLPQILPLSLSILSEYDSGDNGDKLTEQLFEIIINTAPLYNLTITIEINIHQNQSIENNLMKQLNWLQKYYHNDGIYKVYSISRGEFVPLIYVKNAYKIDINKKFLCSEHLNDRYDIDEVFKSDKLKTKFMNAIFIGHIKSKQHADLLRRLCFDGFYTKLPSNGATFASTWKNWSYLKVFAQTYKMLFIPTVGPGFAERNKPPRHGNIQRHRSNGRYYGVAWRTAISNHISFINVASYNNWPEGTQIEEAITNESFMDYSPGKPHKYLDLTAHWVNNFLKTEKPTTNCYEFFNNTIC